MGIIKVENITHVYKSGKGIFDISFEINKGEVFGYLGPNGSGKTTTIRNLMGFTNLDGGVVTIDGLDCRTGSAQLQSNVGYLAGEISFFDNMSGVAFLKLLSDMRGMKDLSKMHELIDVFELEVQGVIKKMSKGMKQKLGIVAAFMHDPDIYILDEPTSGLDPLMKKVFLDMLMAEKKRGKTMFLSSHSFEEVERCCDRAGIIKDGRIVSIEDVKSLKEIKSNSFIISIDNESDIKKILDSDLNAKNVSEGLVQIDIVGDYKDMFLLLAQCKVSGMQVKPKKLEDVFMRYYKKDGEA